MRSKAHIVKTMSFLLALWIKYPELRFCQFIKNALPLEDIYYVEDDVLIDELKKHYNKCDEGMS